MPEQTAPQGLLGAIDRSRFEPHVISLTDLGEGQRDVRTTFSDLVAQPRRDDWVLTPHPGEAARLLGVSSAEVQGDRFAALTALQSRYGGAVVLKGSGSLVLDPRSEFALCPYGNPGMASGGMGDVLSGVVGGLLAQGMRVGDSAAMAMVLHARAADTAATSGGERGLLASDLLPWIRRLANR